MVIERLLERFPYLSTVPDDAPEGLDSNLPQPPPVDWTRAGNVIPTEVETARAEAHAGEDSAEVQSDDGQDQDRGRTEATWEDWALCMGAEIMMELRNEVYTRLHYTCSAVCL